MNEKLVRCSPVKIEVTKILRQITNGLVTENQIEHWHIEIRHNNALYSYCTPDRGKILIDILNKIN